MKEYLVKDEVKEVWDPVGVLARGVAHDFHNLLDAIRCRASLAITQANSADSVREHISQILDSIDKGSEILTLLNDIAQTTECEKQILNFNNLMEEIIDHRFCSREGIVLDVDLFYQELWVSADVEKIRQVVENLLDNAFNALPDGGTVSVKTDIVPILNGSCEKYNLPAGEYMRLTVIDNGVGMPEDVLKHIFMPFYSVGHEGWSERKGLGLTFARDIIDNHGGIIEVWTTPGEGSAFSAYLPLEGRAADETDFDAHSAWQPEKKTLLVVDDEQMILDIMEMMGQELGYEVLTAQNGTQALQEYEQNRERILLVVLDLKLRAPDGLNGPQIFEQLKALDTSVNVVILTGNTMNSEIKKMLADGCIDCLFKPLGLDELENTLAKVSKNNLLSL